MPNLRIEVDKCPCPPRVAQHHAPVAPLTHRSSDLATHSTTSS